MRRVVAPGGTVVLVGGPRGRLLGPLGHVARVKLAPKSRGRRAVFFIADPGFDDLVALRDLIEAGEVKPVVEHRYGLAQIDDAMRRIGTGHAHAKLVVSVDGGSAGAG
jgi:NADPH:quinone reductase-like Zn-dependent oxidoreductase